VNSFLWDLTEPLDLKTAFEGKTCHFYLIDHHSQAEKERIERVWIWSENGVYTSSIPWFSIVFTITIATWGIPDFCTNPMLRVSL
jgi:hypothetical protein